MDDDSDLAHLTSFGVEFHSEEDANENKRSPSVALMYTGFLRRGMVYEMERVLRECIGYFICMSVKYDICNSDVTVIAETSYFVSASFFDRKPME